jgi:hypothetical protein
MFGRELCDDTEARRRGFGDAISARRRRVLHETLTAFEQCQPPGRYHHLAAANLARWKSAARGLEAGTKVQVIPGDWGEVTRSLTKAYGTCFAVLNMAHPHVPGGAYVEGAAAQEENMFRRTDCHFCIEPQHVDPETDFYVPEMTALLCGQKGNVYCDCQKPRICIRGREDRSKSDLGYAWLPEDEVFPFYELRAAAQDLRDGSIFDEGEARRRIVAQLETLRTHGLRFAVLGAFGCGAFMNPADVIARIYNNEIASRKEFFTKIAFAIFSAGYGPDNYSSFAAVFDK